MNAALETLPNSAAAAVEAGAVVVDASAVVADDVVASDTPARPPIDETLIARAMEEAERSSRPVYEVLAEASGLNGDRYARALAEAFDYRFIPAE